MVNGATFQQTAASLLIVSKWRRFCSIEQFAQEKMPCSWMSADGWNTAAVISRNRAIVLSSDRRPQQEEWLGQSLATSPNGLRKGGLNPPTSNLWTLAAAKLSAELVAIFR